MTLTGMYRRPSSILIMNFYNNVRKIKVLLMMKLTTINNNSKIDS